MLLGKTDTVACNTSIVLTRVTPSILVTFRILHDSCSHTEIIYNMNYSQKHLRANPYGQIHNKYKHLNLDGA